jgi:hypothetical protein
MINDCLNNLTKFTENQTPYKQKTVYELACSSACKMIIWVEVGLGGSDHLEDNTLQLYTSSLLEFKQYRTENGIRGDLFHELNVEYLLEKIEVE